MVVWLAWGGLTLVLAYLLGSLPTGYLAGRWLKGIDIRKHGSGSTGATNVLRTLGKGPGFTVLGIDVLKGASSVILTRWFYTLPMVTESAPSSVALESWVPWITIFAALMTVIGHSRSVWLGFTGGKSVASALGLLIALHWPTALIALGVFALTISISRIVSLGSLLGALTVPVVLAVTQQPLPLVLFGIATAMYILATHRRNIQRILNGCEPRIGQKSQDVQSSASSQA